MVQDVDRVTQRLPLVRVVGAMNMMTFIRFVEEQRNRLINGHGVPKLLLFERKELWKPPTLRLESGG